MSLYFDKGANRSLSNLDAAGEEKFTDKQDTLVSGENIKTINGVSVLGEGNIEVGEGGTITVNQTYDPTSSYAQSGTAVADALANSMEAVSQNGTISNCILEIPQNLKLTLENNVLTLKSGSILVKSGSTYVTTTTTQDRSRTIPSTQAQGRYFVFAEENTGVLQGLNNIVTITSGTTAQRPEWSLSIAHTVYFDVDTKIFYYATGTQWIEWVVAYPLCIIDVDSNGVASFAKDSNGNDMIFNGAGFIGHHAFVYPNVKDLVPNGKDEGGKLKSTLATHPALEIFEMSDTGTGTVCFVFRPAGTIQRVGYMWHKNYNDLQPVGSIIQYVEKDNLCYIYNSSTGYTVDTSQQRGLFVRYKSDGISITQFDIRQPVCLATTEMLDKVQDQIDTNTTAISGKQDTLVSGTNIKTINSTTVLGSGNFALADQSLSNLSADGQLIIDSQNGTISNCILEVPQNIKLTLENNVLTLKAGSTVVLTGSTYTTSTNTSDIARTLSLSQGRYYIWRDNSTTIASPRSISDVTSGTTPPETATINFGTFYNINDKYCYQYTSNGWVKRAEWSYPLCIIDVDSQGNASFAKDSNGNDMIFNGWCFIGGSNGTQVSFITYPNVSVLQANGNSDNETLNSTKITTNSLIITNRTSPVENCHLCIVSANQTSLMVFTEVDDFPENPVTSQAIYNKKENRYYDYSGSYWIERKRCPIVKLSKTASSIDILEILKPYEGARDLLTDSLQADVTTLTGYDSTQTQTLKNINGVLTWVTD